MSNTYQNYFVEKYQKYLLIMKICIHLMKIIRLNDLLQNLSFLKLDIQQLHIRMCYGSGTRTQALFKSINMSNSTASLSSIYCLLEILFTFVPVSTKNPHIFSTVFELFPTSTTSIQISLISVLIAHIIMDSDLVALGSK